MSERASLLLVDDSASVLAFEKAALSNYYRVATASNGAEALRLLAELRPDGMVLDLSMPEMDGDEVLKRVRADESMRDLGVLILSTEGQRARDCLAMGADDFLLKPSTPEEMRARVSAVLEQAARRKASRQHAFLFFRVGSLELGLPLGDIERVLPMLALRPLPGMPDWMTGWFELGGKPAAVADFASLAKVEHRTPLMDRKLLLLRGAKPRLALCVDYVRDPEELDQSLLEPSEEWIPPAAEALRGRLDCLARAGQGLIPVLKAEKFFQAVELEALATQLDTIGKADGVPQSPAADAGKPRRGKNRV